MKRIKYIVLFLCLATQVVAQEKKFYPGIHLFPNISEGLVISDGSLPENAANTVRELEIPKYSFSAGISLAYQFNESLFLSTGILYQNNGEATNEQDLLYAQPEPTQPVKVRWVYSHHNIEVPIHVKYFATEKLYVISGPGVVFNVQNRTAGVYTYADGSTERTSAVNAGLTEFRPVNVQATAGFGLQFSLGEKISWYVQPTVQYMLMGIAVDVPLNRKTVSYGLGLGILLQ